MSRLRSRPALPSELSTSEVALRHHESTPKPAVSSRPIPLAERVAITIPYTQAVSGLGRTKIYEEIREGRLRTTKIGKRTLIFAASLLELLENGARPAAVALAGAPNAPIASEAGITPNAAGITAGGNGKKRSPKPGRHKSKNRKAAAVHERRLP